MRSAVGPGMVARRFDDRLSGIARALLDKLELAPRVANECLASAPRTLLHGDFYLDNFVFENQSEPAILDWARPLKGPPALNVAALLFGITSSRKYDYFLIITLTSLTRFLKSISAESF